MLEILSPRASTLEVLRCHMEAVSRLHTWGFMGSYKNGVISRAIVQTTHTRGLITPLITTHEPPSKSGV